ncbi:MAG TPA: hypothetical protein VD789_03160 [Thermomicrobiales bacterium]|nr:hypothetical protein [Thermomicrobiales bacterium]
MRRAIATTALVSLVMALASVWSASAQTPEATPDAPFAAWTVEEVRAFEVDGDLVALSPDGRWIAGIGADGGSICVWDTESLDPTCAGENLRIQTQPLAGSMAWAPDSSAVAFINGITQLLEPTDVMLFDIEHASLTRLTNTAATGRVMVHTGPAWTSDSNTVVFAQTDPATSGDEQSSIIYYDREANRSEPVPFDDDFFVYAPVVVLPDDSVVFRVDLAPGGTENAGLWRVDPDGGNLSQVLAADEIDTPVPLGVSRNGEYISVASATAISRSAPDEAYFLIDTESGDVAPVNLGDDGEVVGQPILSPIKLFAIVQDGSGFGTRVVVMDLETNETQVLEGLEVTEPWTLKPPTWSKEGTVLIPGLGGGTLVTIAQQTEPAPLE